MEALRVGDLVYHDNTNESRFVGRSRVSSAAQIAEGGFQVGLKHFTPIVADVGLEKIRDKADEIYALRDKLEGMHGSPLYLPFQFTQDHSQLRMMSNYLTKAPAELIEILFGKSGFGLDEN